MGNNGAADLSDTDLAGNQRIFDGDGDEVAVVDQGAYEFLEIPLFADGFESGDLSVWSSSQP